MTSISSASACQPIYDFFTPGYYISEEMCQQAIDLIPQLRSMSEEERVKLLTKCYIKIDRETEATLVDRLSFVQGWELADKLSASWDSSSFDGAACLSWIQEIHKIVVSESSGYRNASGGVRRNQYSGPSLESPEFLENVYKKAPEEVLKWYEIFLLFEKFEKELYGSDAEDPIKKSRVFNEKQKEMISRYLFIPVSPLQIPKKMEKFANTLVRRLQDDTEDPIVLASWAHTRLVKIHPFADGNGRTARILINLIFQIKKVAKVFFPFTIPYDAAIQRTIDGDLKAFERFLRSRVEEIEASFKIDHELGLAPYTTAQTMVFLQSNIIPLEKVFNQPDVD